MKSIANYEILETIAETGPSAVYIARHKKLGRKTLLKVYSGAEQALIDRFEREARIVAELNSDAIVEIYDFGEDKGRFFISMEYIDGWNLDEYLVSHELSDEEIIDFSYQISYCVAVLHQKGYIHRDLKPENILVDRSKRIKLTDFGLTLHESMNRITSEGDLLGTPLYMSPEQINNTPLTTASDVFALGVIFYQMASKQNPFNAQQVGEVFSKILSFDPPDISSVRSSLPHWYCDLVHQLLQKDSKKRPASALEVLYQIKEHSNVHWNNEIPLSLQTHQKSGKQAKLLYASLIMGLIILGYFFGFDYIKENFWGMTDSTLQQTPDLVADTTIHAQSDTLLKQETDLTKPPTHAQNNRSPLSDSTLQYPLTNGKTTFFVKTYPWCKVYLDYKLVGITPLSDSILVKAGKYVLGLQNPNYPSYTDTIRIEPFKNNVFTYNLDSLLLRIELQVLPWGNVYIDDKFIGTTPLQNPLYLAPGKHVLKITNDFYPTWVDTIVYHKNSANRKRIVLDLKNINSGIN